MAWCSSYGGYLLNDDVFEWDLTEVEVRALEEAIWVVDNRHSIRCTARNFCRSKSTVHRDLNERLPKLSTELYLVVRRILKRRRN